MFLCGRSGPTPGGAHRDRVQHHGDPRLGVGANQDVALLFVSDDLVLWESGLVAESFDAPYADSMGVLFRTYSYAALVVDRYAASLGQISGTGMTPPVYP